MTMESTSSQSPAEGELISGLKQSAKYGALCDETLSRIASWALARESSPKDALKLAKRKLHQVYGAYLESWDFRGVAAAVRAMPSKQNMETVRSACRDILLHHLSTRERAGIMEQVFPVLSEEIGPMKSILDLACGLGPFMLPWMCVEEEVEYTPCDIDTRLAGIINEFLPKLGLRPTAECRDLLVSAPEKAADVAFLFKALPCLEQQEKGAGERLLSRLRARVIVASFPTRSIGGNAKGMPQRYDAYLQTVAATTGFSVRPHCFRSETFYVLTRRN